MFRVLDRISRAGRPDRANEDACGTAGPWAWVIDTSIFPGTPALLHPLSDAAWLAGFTSEHLVALAPDAKDGPALMRQVMQEARETFLAEAPAERHDVLTWPVGAMTLVRAREGRLDVWSFADTSAYVRRPDGTVLTVGEAPELRLAESAMAAALLAETGSTPTEILAAPAFQDWLRERRERQREGGGMPLLGLIPEAADGLRHESVDLEPGTIVLLASDGFSALVDLYRHVDARGLIETALSNGLESLVREARRIEAKVDPTGKLFPRFKVSDDATGLLLKCDDHEGPAKCYGQGFSLD